MAFLKTGQRIKVSEIWVDRTERQRRELDPDHIKALADSILRMKGLIHPIVVKKKAGPDGQPYELKVGECRFEAHKLLGWEEIDVRFNNSEDPIELEILELEENLKRRDLPWQDRCLSELRLFEKFKSLDPSWTITKTAEAIGIDQTTLSNDIKLAEEIRAGNEAVLNAEKPSQAHTALKRAAGVEREAISALLFDSTPEIRQKLSEGKVEELLETTVVPKSKPVLCGDAIEWMKSYSGPKFNFIHCDFPYGVGMHKTGQASKALDDYEDTPDIYFNLLEAFVKHYQRFGASMAHIMFWYSAKYRERTRDLLEEIPGAYVFEHDLIWHKTDGKGIVSDPLNRPRHVYETALMVRVGERQIRKIVNDCVGHPTDSARSHLSRKPPGVLGHFFPMFIDKDTSLLDPTCGSGSALQVGRNLGAREVLGIERDQKIVDEILL